jgi:hypothetical protein
MIVSIGEKINKQNVEVMGYGEIKMSIPVFMEIDEITSVNT